MGNLDWDVLLIPVIVVGVILILGLAFWARYKTVGPDEAMIVTGSFWAAKIFRKMSQDVKSKLCAAAVRSSCLCSSSLNLFRYCHTSSMYPRLRSTQSRVFLLLLTGWRSLRSEAL